MLHRLLWAGFAAGIANFALFWIGAVYLGGDAINGKAADGHYFLAEHGHLTEVTPQVFNYSKWHARSVFFTHPFAIVCAWLLSRSADNHRKPGSIG